MAVFIRPAVTIEDCRAIVNLQSQIWGFADLDVTPDHLLLALAKEGNMALLAVEEPEKPVGFAFGFLAFAGDGRLKLASHQVGVLPAYQGAGIGYALKLAQRQAALALKLELVSWTFDPLQARNAYLNLTKLGAVSNTYWPNLYGNMGDQLNQGLPTDRFRVDWWVASNHVARTLAGEPPAVAAGPVVNESVCLPGGWRAPGEGFSVPQAPTCRVEVPLNLGQLKLHAPDLARQWRLHTRRVFTALFAAGYVAVRFERQADRAYYLLRQDWGADS